MAPIRSVHPFPERTLRLRGTGDHEGVGALMGEYGRVGPVLQADLERLSRRGIPVDVVLFERGLATLRR